jgi:hypothetical protein
MIGARVPEKAMAQDSLSNWITTIATVLICVLTVVLAVETWRLREVQAKQIKEFILESNRPNVSVELSGSHVGMNFMNVRVINSGKGIARKITFQFFNRNDQPATTQTEPIISVFHKLAMFRLGIQSLGINQELKSYIFSFVELKEKLTSDVFSQYVNIHIRFEDTEGNEYVNVFVIDFSQYEGFSEIGGNSLSKLADEAKHIRTELQKIGEGSSRLAVDIHSAEDRAEEHTELMNRLARQRRRATGQRT